MPSCARRAPAVPHGHNARELAALVSRGMTPLQALRAATVTSAELVELDGELGRLREGYLADIIAVPGDPPQDITVTQDVRFVMKGGHVFKAPDHNRPEGSTDGTRSADRRIAPGLD
jgi:imidazolonepropionase-like amidohydrolase